MEVMASSRSHFHRAPKSRKRPRSANWDEKEKMTFVNIVMNHLTVIEDKNKTIISNKRKDEAWQEIQQYMDQLGYKRDAYRLREQWLRMKAQAKKAIKTYHKEVGDNNKTCSVPPPTAIDYMIRDIVPHEFVDDDENLDDPEVPSAEVWTAQNPKTSSGDANSEQNTSERTDAQKFCEVIEVESDAEKVEAIGTTNEGETTDTADGSDGPPKNNSREEFNNNSDGSARHKRSRSTQRIMTSFERATLELQRMKTEAAMRQEAELHKVKMEAALWERRFWEAKLLRVRGYRL